LIRVDHIPEKHSRERVPGTSRDDKGRPYKIIGKYARKEAKTEGREGPAKPRRFVAPIQPRRLEAVSVMVLGT
jgi:hypothetical protein